MALQSLASPAISRRALMRSGAFLVAGGAMAAMPLGGALRASNAGAMWPNVARTVERYVADGKVANMVVSFGLGRANPDALARGTLGFGRRSGAGLDSLYRIYSMTKPITGMATMMLIDEGKLGLDQPLAEILPAFAEMRVLTAPDAPLDSTVPAERPITIRQLLTHTAGLGYDIVNKGPLLEAYLANGITSSRVSRIPIPGIAQVETAPGLATWAQRLAKLPLVAQPGTKWIYSCSIDLLGRVIEVASGQSFESFLQERLFDPCGMTSTFWQVPPGEIERLTDNYGILGGIPIPVDPAATSVFLDPPPMPWGGSGLVSSPADYDRFLKMLLGHGKLDGRRVMGELAVRIGTSNLLPDTATTQGSWLEGQGVGAGGRVQGQSFGWGGAAGTLAAVDFSAGLRAGLFTQYMPSEAYPVRDEFLAALERDMQVMMRGAA